VRRGRCSLLLTSSNDAHIVPALAYTIAQWCWAAKGVAMFCPNCGQQQMAPEVRYCSRCGFSLRGVLSVRRKDIVQGALLMFIGLMIIFGFNDFMRGAVDGMTEIIGSKTPFVWSSAYILPFFSAVFFLWGLARIVFALDAERISRLKRQREAPAPGQPLPLPVSGSAPPVLPRAQSIPVMEPGRRPMDTAELVAPASGAEETTKPLKNR
jgi:hypothetical protein